MSELETTIKNLNGLSAWDATLRGQVDAHPQSYTKQMKLWNSSLSSLVNDRGN